MFVNQFDLAPQQNVSEMLREGDDYVVYKDGHGFEHKIVNFNNPKYCQRKGIIELEALKKSNKHGNNKMFRKCMDKNTGLLWGFPTSINSETKELQFKAYWIEDKMTFDLSIPDQAIAWAIIKNSPFVEGSPNQHGKSVYKVIDRVKSAASEIDKRSQRRKAEDIIESLKGEELFDTAYILGINVDANQNIFMITNEIYRIMENNPAEFLKLYNDPSRPYSIVFNKGLAKGIVIRDVKSQEYLYGSLPIGSTKEAAIKYLMDNVGIAGAINSKCDVLDEQSKVSMNKMLNKDVDETEALKAEIAALRAEKAKLTSEELKEEVVFEDKFSTMVDLEHEELKTKAKEYKISGYNLPTMTKEKLKSKVEEFEAKLEKK
jgi:hypothetical protein